MSVSESSTEVTIDHRGDLKLKVGKTHGTETVFKICSRAICRASPVFDRMLYSNFSESKANSTNEDGVWSVDLPSDKPAAMEIFLNICHANFSRVPKVLSVDDLYDLTVLTHYWDATQMLCPWITRWMESVEEIVNDANMLQPKMLWIAWELGRKKIFEVTVDRMLMETEGSWSQISCQLLDVQTPPDIIECIDAVRITTFHSLIDIFREMAEHLIVVDERPRWCRHATWMGPHRCESMILGSMTFCLARAGLWPLPEAKQMEYSIVGLYRKLTNLIIHDIGPEVAEKPLVNHAECNPGPYLLQQIKVAMDQIPSPMNEMHKRHLGEQEERLRH